MKRTQDEVDIGSAVPEYLRNGGVPHDCRQHSDGGTESDGDKSSVMGWYAFSEPFPERCT